jgi:hypothetical protein
VGYDVLIDNDAFLVTDFMNFKINPTQSFKDAHMDRVCMRVFIEIMISIYNPIGLDIFNGSLPC